MIMMTSSGGGREGGIAGLALEIGSSRLFLLLPFLPLEAEEKSSTPGDDLLHPSGWLVTAAGQTHRSLPVLSKRRRV